MVLEDLIKVREARRNPFIMFFLSILLSSIGIIVAYATFPSSASVLSIAFVTVGMMPILYHIFLVEEKEEANTPGCCTTFLERHFDLILIYSFIFIGLIVSYSFWYVFLPEEVRGSVFAEQEKAVAGIQNLKAELTGNVSYSASMPCSKDPWCWFGFILENNTKVLFLALMMSFVYGVGAIFLIAWNASVIGVVIGKDALNVIAVYAGLGPFSVVASYAHGLVNAIGLIPHGVPELLGYFVGAIAGGIISVAITKGKHLTHEFEIILKDVGVLVLIAFLLLVLGALIEAHLIVLS